MVSYGFCSSIAVVEQWDWAERMVYEKWDTLKAFRQFIFPCLTLQEKEMEKQRLLYQQARLHNRGAAEMVLQMISACKGTWSPLHTHTNTIGSFQVFFFFFFKLELSIYCSTCHPKNTFFLYRWDRVHGLFHLKTWYFYSKWRELRGPTG